mmetsp:Transcript_30602/g.33432  ORF Transcript_30602/g.33432 Transcript_30602/m.33432 type:complete len:384 (-) Transcript_30602:364-1515(-)
MNRSMCLARYALIFLFQLLLSLPVASKIVFEDYFDDLKNWVVHIDGHTGVVQLVNESSTNVYTPIIVNQSHPNVLHTNISTCLGKGYCYRSEAAMLPKLRPKMFASCSEEYWLGFSLYLPESNYYPDVNYPDIAYHFQLHGGDNDGTSPVVGIREEKGYWAVNVCGSTDGVEVPYCRYVTLGKIVPGKWTDFVINSQLAFGTSPSAVPYGWIKMWMNHKLVLDLSNLWTAYNNIKVPYLITGSYQINWKFNQTGTPYNWVGCYHRGIKLGDVNSTYDEVFISGRENPDDTDDTITNPPSSTSSSGSNDDSSGSLAAYIAPAVLVGLILTYLLFQCCPNGIDVSCCLRSSDEPLQPSTARKLTHLFSRIDQRTETETQTIEITV